MPLSKTGMKIKKAFLKEYTGKKVPKKYQSKYGKTYSKKEAESVFYAYENKYNKLKKYKMIKPKDAIKMGISLGVLGLGIGALNKYSKGS